MQTIVTKILPVTRTKPKRVKATHEGAFFSVTIRADGYDEDQTAHCDAARLLMQKLEWRGTMAGGCLAAGKMAFVFVSNADTAPEALTDKAFCKTQRRKG